MLVINNLCKTYKKSKQLVKAVDDLSFAVQSGEIIGLLGANGSGKTTTIKCISNLLIQDSGEVTLDGKRVNRTDVSAVLEGVRNIYFNLTIYENLKYFGSLRAAKLTKADYDEAIQIMGLQEYKNTVCNALSLGYKQRTAIACSLLGNKKILLLDEPTLGLDIATRAMIMDTIRNIAKRGTHIIVTSHDMDFIQRTVDRVVLVQHGKKIAEDKVDALMNRVNKQNYEIEFTEFFGEKQEMVKANLPDFCTEVQFKENSLSFLLEKTDGLFEVLKVLRDNDLHIQHFNANAPSLEKAYSILTSTAKEQPND